jgi:hypothetical protein
MAAKRPPGYALQQATGCPARARLVSRETESYGIEGSGVINRAMPARRDALFDSPHIRIVTGVRDLSVDPFLELHTVDPLCPYPPFAKSRIRRIASAHRLVLKRTHEHARCRV